MRLPRTPFRWAQNILLFLSWVWLFMQWGCATGGPLPTPQLRDGSEQAVHIAWVEVYGRTDRPPKVRWVQGDKLTCTDPDSGKGGFPQWHLPKGSIDPADAVAVCHEGLTLSPLECMVAWHDERTFSETALAHELMHVLLARRFIDDPDHERLEWSTLVPLANDRILKAGL